MARTKMRVNLKPQLLQQSLHLNRHHQLHCHHYLRVLLHHLLQTHLQSFQQALLLHPQRI